jgi:hypothetical protein
MPRKPNIVEQQQGPQVAASSAGQHMKEASIEKGKKHGKK